MSARAQLDTHKVVVLDTAAMTEVGRIPDEVKLIMTPRDAFSAYLALKEVFKDHPDA